MKVSASLGVFLAIISLAIPGCTAHKEEHHSESHVITATRPQYENVTITQAYVCQIHSRRHIEVRALERGYLDAIQVKEGQAVKEAQVLFNVIPAIYKARLEAQKAAAETAKLEFNYSKKLLDDKVVSDNEVALFKTKVVKAEAEVKRAEAEFNFATVKAPFDGIIDRLRFQQGSLVEEGDILTTLSDNDLMWVYFNVPETRYLEYMANISENTKDMKIELVLANGNKFNQLGQIAAIESDFKNTSGNIQFRADFPNPSHLLRNGQTGTVMMSRVEDNAIVIPQRSTFDFLNKKYVYVVDKDHVAHRREIVVKHELEDIFVLSQGLTPDDEIILEGVRQVHDGETVDYVDRPPEEVARHLKFHAE